MTFYDVYTKIQQTTQTHNDDMSVALNYLQYPTTSTDTDTWILHCDPAVTVDALYHCSTCPTETGVCPHALAIMIHQHLETDPMPTPLSSTIDAWATDRAFLEAFVKEHLVEGTDYYTMVIGGRETTPSLSKAGSEKFLKLFGLRPVFTVDHNTWEMFGKEVGLVCYTCTLVNADGEVVAEGKGARKASQDRQPNSTIKMGLKSSMIDATLRYGALSGMFTQDLEDMKEELNAKDAPTTPTQRPAPAPKAPPVTPKASQAARPPQASGEIENLYGYEATASRFRVYQRKSDGMIFVSVLSPDLPEEYQQRGIPIWEDAILDAGLDPNAITMEYAPDINGWRMVWREYLNKNKQKSQRVDKLINPVLATLVPAQTNDEEEDIPF